jgi:alpha-mannosidase
MTSQLQNDDTRGIVRSLVATGRLTFSNGGFTMFDEAGPSYVDMLDQTTLGIRFILAEFGPSG